MTQFFLKQNNYSATETREISKYCMVSDFKVVSSSIEDLHKHEVSLSNGVAIPVGTVEFVRRAMELSKLREPENDTYPVELQSFLKRKVKKVFVGSVTGHAFVKPIKTKTFTGFIFDTFKEPKEYNEHDQEQLEVFLSLPSSERIWESDVVVWNSESRYYVQNGDILGHARYDDGPDEWPEPDRKEVEIMVNKICERKDAPIAFCLDVGVLRDTGETALVEFNDAWAIGLYRDAITAKQYANFLISRWNQIMRNNHA